MQHDDTMICFISDSSMDYDSSWTEEEMERSLREVLPSEDQCKKLRHEASLTHVGPIGGDLGHGKICFEMNTFSQFNTDLARSYITQEETRMQHQVQLNLLFGFCLVLSIY